jgi:hypothetical protein
MLLIAIALAGAAPCDARTAIDTSVSAILAEPGRWRGRCVRITAPASRWQLFRGNRVASKGWLRHGQIGAYWPAGMKVDDASIRSARGWTVIGTVSSCKREYKRAVAEASRDPADHEGAPFVMMTGYCHYFSGTSTILFMVQAEPALDFEG